MDFLNVAEKVTKTFSYLVMLFIIYLLVKYTIK